MSGVGFCELSELTQHFIGFGVRALEADERFPDRLAGEAQADDPDTRLRRRRDAPGQGRMDPIEAGIEERAFLGKLDLAETGGRMFFPGIPEPVALLLERLLFVAKRLQLVGDERIAIHQQNHRLSPEFTSHLRPLQSDIY